MEPVAVKRAPERKASVPAASPATKRKRRIVYGAVILLVALTVFVMALSIRNIADSRAYDRYMQEAQTAAAAGDFDSALSSLRKAGTIDATDDCLLLMSRCYEAQGNYDKAIQAMRYMATNSSAVSSRIASLENQKNKEAQAGQVSVAGDTHSVTETSLVLDGKGLGNDVLQEITQLYSLSNLSIANNYLTDISPLASLGGLTTLNLNNNQITSVKALAGLSGLRTLYLDNNPITDISSLSALTGLTSLSIKGIDITESQLEKISASLPNCAINGANAREEEQVVALGGVTFNADVRELDLSGRGLTDISGLSACTKLTIVNLNNNAISDISPLMDIPNLATVYLAGNAISDLRPLMGLTNLKYLDVSYNSIYSTVPLGAVTSLTDLNLAGNPISNFSGIRKLKNLVNLDVMNTGMSDDAVQYFTYLTKLQRLSIEYNNISGEGYNALRSYIPSCSISHSDLVYSVDAGSTAVDSNAVAIDFTGRGLEDISWIMNMPYLQQVRLGSNRISNIYYLQYTDSWRTMTYLDLSDNFISDITPVAGLQYLTTLNLSYNQITNVSILYNMVNLRELYLSGNPLTDEQLRELNSHLPYCSIFY